ncbi:hypothetical protein E4U55_005105 [Claviceps digitariae]|nr:hypothetical protein E4U55_005105 [Claviceps digitariae]
MSAFTALNGGSPKVTESPAEKCIKVCTSDEGTRFHSQTSPKSSSALKDGWSTQTIDRSPFPSGGYTNADANEKRKRSVSTESASRTAQTPEATPVGPPNKSRELASTPQRENSKHFEEEGRDREVSWSSQHLSRAERNGYESQQDSVASPHGQAEEPNGNALQRASGHQDHSDCTNNSPDAEDRSAATCGSPYEGEQQQESMLHHDSKKRKRNFSNRTKTGCFTCRRRKKKCDEQKPECSNCIRGGFLCQGYPPQRGAGWPKPDTKAPAVPLESKDPSYVPPGAYGMPQHGAYGPQPVKREPLPHYRGQHLRIDPPQGRPLVVMNDDDRPTASATSTLTSAASATSPDNKLSAIPYNPSNVFPTPISANTQAPPFGDRMGKDYQRVPALHDLGRGNEPETPHPGSHLPQINLLHPNRPGSPATPHTAAPHPPAPSSSVQAAAQLALTHSHAHAHSHSHVPSQSQSHTPSHSQAHSHTQPQPQVQPLPQPQAHPQAQSQYPQRRTQKDEMLSGRHFYPFDKELCLERERCAAACWRFNNLTSPPTIGVSPDERHRLFLEILQPRDSVRVPASEASTVTKVGRVGRHVAVETPFTCDYGYNIVIGHHVLVGRNCTINDASEVKIGDNCVIGPNVSIFTTSLPIDPKSRQGGQGPQVGRAITIEQDCWIAGGAIILPGCTIGKGSTVGAGSVVTRDVPPFTVVSGNPARVMHGVGKEGP